MFRKDQHREDLLAAQENERKALNMVITVLADQIEWLRWQHDKAPHFSTAMRGLTSEQLAPADEPDFNPFMSEEEEELLALRLNDHINDQELQTLREEVGKVIPLPRLEPDA